MELKKLMRIFFFSFSAFVGYNHPIAYSSAKTAD